jgi:hypothetical protein
MTNYSELTDEEALEQIVNHHDLNASEFAKDEIISPQDVLYWMDAFGDFSMAINLQPLPKDLPDRIYENINEFDVLNDWQGKVNEWTDPLTGRDMYEFDWKHDWIYYDEWGSYHPRIEYLSDPGGYYWQSDPEGAMKMIEPRQRNFSRFDSKYNTRVYLGETNEVTGFTNNGTIVRWDMEWHDTSRSQWTDFYDTPFDAEEFARAITMNDITEYMEEHGFVGIHIDEYDRGHWQAKHKLKDILGEWQRSGGENPTDPTHPDIDYTYVMKRGQMVWVPKGKKQHFIDEVNDQIYFRTGQREKLQDLRGTA